MQKDKLAVVIVPDDWKKFTLVNLRHPRSQSAALFAINSEENQLAEVISMDDTYASWFIGDRVGEKPSQLKLPTDRQKKTKIQFFFRFQKAMAGSKAWRSLIRYC